MPVMERVKRTGIDFISYCKERIFTFTAKFTERRGHAIDLTMEGIDAGFRKIITVGGDGTLNEVVNGVFLNSHCPTNEISPCINPCRDRQ